MKRNTPRPAQRESDEAMRARGVTPFLRPEHVQEGEVLMLTGFNYIGKDGQFCVTVAKPTNPDADFVLGIREGTPDHKKFFTAFGNDHKSWAPGNVTVTIGKGNRPGSDVSFVNVKDVEPL